jgi:hypothetical protein
MRVDPGTDRPVAMIASGLLAAQLVARVLRHQLEVERIEILLRLTGARVSARLARTVVLPGLRDTLAFDFGFVGMCGRGKAGSEGARKRGGNEDASLVVHAAILLVGPSG